MGEGGIRLELALTLLWIFYFWAGVSRSLPLYVGRGVCSGYNMVRLSYMLSMGVTM